MEDQIIDPTAAFSSPFICDRLAGRALKEMNAHSVGVGRQFAMMMVSLLGELESVNKFRRGSLGSIAQRFVTKLENEPAIAEIAHEDHTPSLLSTKEHHHLRFCVMLGDSDSEQWLEFLAADVALSRKRVVMSQAGIDTMIHRHALTRYMQRERKSASELLENIMPAVKLAPMLAAHSIAETDEPHIAVPLGDGMLLGRFMLVSTQKLPRLGHKVVIGGKNVIPSKEEGVIRRTFLPGVRIVIKFMTYIDSDAMTETRSKLHRQLLDYQTEHSENINRIFDLIAYDDNMARSERQLNALFDNSEGAFSGAEAIVSGQVWKDFVSTVGAYDAKDG